jgi:ergothioneine biosynthesis protein EgtB
MTQEQLAKLFEETRLTSVNICEPLETEDTVVQPIEDISPPKWHLGHTTWFYEKFILEKFENNFKPYNEAYNYLFNSYYESAGVRAVRSTRGNLSRPLYKEVLAYRENVNDRMLSLLSKKVDTEVLQLLELGIHHENQHQELLLTDIKYILGVNPLLPGYKTMPDNEIMNIPSLDLEFLPLEEGMYNIGNNGSSFCYDNELPTHKAHIASIAISNRCITNAEFLEFIKDAGYERFDLWLSEGWTWLKENQITAPLYWFKNEGKWKYFTLHGLQDLHPNAPVAHISYFEADAFAHWKQMRLPTEFEWEIASVQFTNTNKANLLGNGILTPVPAQNYDFIGNVWEWTLSSYLPYPGYKQPDGAIGEYNGKFMINQMVLRGGSCVTPDAHIRNSYRNFFQTDKRWQFSGFRLVKEQLL